MPVSLGMNSMDTVSATQLHSFQWFRNFFSSLIQGESPVVNVWLPLYNIANTDAICITLIDRIDIIIT